MGTCGCVQIRQQRACFYGQVKKHTGRKLRINTRATRRRGGRERERDHFLTGAHFEALRLPGPPSTPRAARPFRLPSTALPAPHSPRPPGPPLQLPGAARGCPYSGRLRRASPVLPELTAWATSGWEAPADAGGLPHAHPRGIPTVWGKRRDTELRKRGGS